MQLCLKCQKPAQLSGRFPARKRRKGPPGGRAVPTQAAHGGAPLPRRALPSCTCSTHADASPHVALVLAEAGTHSPADQKALSASDAHPKAGVLDVQPNELLISAGTYRPRDLLSAPAATPSPPTTKQSRLPRGGNSSWRHRHSPVFWITQGALPVKGR